MQVYRLAIHLLFRVFVPDKTKASDMLRIVMERRGSLIR